MVEPVYDTVHVVSVVDSAFSANVNEYVESAFGNGIELAVVVMTVAAAIVMLGMGIHRAIGN